MDDISDTFTGSSNMSRSIHSLVPSSIIAGTRSYIWYAIVINISMYIVDYGGHPLKSKSLQIFPKVW